METICGVRTVAARSTLMRLHIGCKINNTGAEEMMCQNKLSHESIGAKTERSEFAFPTVKEEREV